MTCEAKYSFSFGPFRLFPAQRMLLEDDRPVRLGSRALDILIALLERPGELLSKEDLIAQVWPNTIVEDVSLRVHIAALRRTLREGDGGHRYLATIPGRGYRFVAPVTRVNESAPAGMQECREEPDNLPVPLAGMVGRTEAVAALVAQLSSHRFITIAGPGGIGKTSVAIAACHALRPHFPDGIQFAELAPLASPHLVPSAVCALLGARPRSDNLLPVLLAFLRGKRLLLVLDSCEHVVEAAASLSEAIFEAAPEVHILATSREPLRAKGERVQRLPPLGFPGEGTGMRAAEALSFPAIRLFADRVAAKLDGFVIGDADVPYVVEICRRLDGIPLAIELAAGRVEAFGLQGVAQLLGERLLPAAGRRTAEPRHQTLTAMLDWSYDLLPDRERTILRRMAVFVSGFTLDAVRAVAADDAIAGPHVIESFANLVAKSLVAADIANDTVRYRLFDTTRAYAYAKLTESGDLAEIARRHAEYHKDLLQCPEMDMELHRDWPGYHGFHIDDVRAALSWAFSPAGDPAAAIALTIAAAPLWLQLSLLSECRMWVEQALSRLACNDPNLDGEMRLRAALAATIMNTFGAGPEMNAAWARVLEIAEKLGNTDYQLRALWGLWVDHRNKGEFPPALGLAQTFNAIAAATGKPSDMSIGDRMMGISLHYMGDQTAARQHIERMLARDLVPLGRSHIIRFQFDQQVAARCFQALILLLQGFPDQAMAVASRNVEDALRSNHAISLSYALSEGACPVSLFAGDFAAAGRYATLLIELSRSHGLDVWNVLGQCSQAQLLIRTGDLAAGLPRLRAALGNLRNAWYAPRVTTLLGELAEATGRAGDVSSGLAMIGEALARSRCNEELWCLPELLRIKGELILLERTEGAEEKAQAQFLDSLEMAAQHKVLAWQLRTATSLARLWQSQDRGEEAWNLLGPIYGHYTEGFATPDLAAARDLLGDLPPGRAPAVP